MHYIYIPGFGDRFNLLRRLALRRWVDTGVQVSLVPMQWSDRSETYQQKYERVLEVIATSTDNDIRLVGESAGAAMALYVFLQDKERVTQVTTVCGYVHTAEAIVAYQRRRHPAFYPLVCEVDMLLSSASVGARRRVTMIYSRRDTVVEPTYSRIEGAKQVLLATPGHITSIGYVLVRGLGYFR